MWQAEEDLVPCGEPCLEQGNQDSHPGVGGHEAGAAQDADPPEPELRREIREMPSRLWRLQVVRVGFFFFPSTAAAAVAGSEPFHLRASVRGPAS